MKGLRAISIILTSVLLGDNCTSPPSEDWRVNCGKKFSIGSSILSSLIVMETSRLEVVGVKVST